MSGLYKYMTVVSCGILLAACKTGSSNAPTTSSAEQAKARTMSEIIEASNAADWRELDPEQTLYFEFSGKRVVIELAPQFAPEHVANIKLLAQQGYWDGLSINRSQDNFVVQWGDAAENEADRKSIGEAKGSLPAEFSTNIANISFNKIPDADAWAPAAGFAEGFPIGIDQKTATAWLAHCYGTIGAGRDTAPDSSNGAQLYVVTGQSPRQLDLNITTVGRVVQGMEHLSVIPRGPAPMGFFDKPEQRVKIDSIKLASQVAQDQRSNLQIMRTDTSTFAELVESRRNRRDQWYVRPAGHIDLCNIPIPVRPTPSAIATP